MSKYCSKCDTTKPETEFHTRKTRKGTVTLRSHCKPCNLTKAKLRKYDLPLEDYNAMYVKQKGCCPICNQHKDRLVIDHCHRTGKVRGLLCNPCNQALGFLRDDPVSLSNAIDYLI